MRRVYAAAISMTTLLDITYHNSMRIFCSHLILSSLCISIFLTHIAPATEQTSLFNDGKCESNGKSALNLNFFGECGQLPFPSKPMRNMVLENKLLRKMHGVALVFADSTLMNVNLSYGNLKELAFIRSHGYEVKLQRSTLSGLRLVHTKLSYSDLSSSILKGSKCHHSHIDHVSFKETDLTDSNFTQCKVLDSDFSGAKMTNMQLHLTTLKGSTFDKKTQLPFSIEEALRRGMKAAP